VAYASSVALRAFKVFDAPDGGAEPLLQVDHPVRQGAPSVARPAGGRTVGQREQRGGGRGVWQRRGAARTFRCHWFCGGLQTAHGLGAAVAFRDLATSCGRLTAGEGGGKQNNANARRTGGAERERQAGQQNWRGLPRDVTYNTRKIMKIRLLGPNMPAGGREAAPWTASLRLVPSARSQTTSLAPQVAPTNQTLACHSCEPAQMLGRASCLSYPRGGLSGPLTPRR
jgi:hypothetical protein